MDESETPSAESRQTAFHRIMSKTAAGFMEEAGWWWVTGFGDPEKEYQAVRGGGGGGGVWAPDKGEVRAGGCRRLGRLAPDQVGLPGAGCARGGATSAFERHPRDADGTGPLRGVPR